ncbi:hypothetical protein [Sinorhizobium meliloti]|nr:hypothetical protein [Sinorhizobium meliloti]
MPALSSSLSAVRIRRRAAAAIDRINDVARLVDRTHRAELS